MAETTNKKETSGKVLTFRDDSEGKYKNALERMRNERFQKTGITPTRTEVIRSLIDEKINQAQA